MMGDATMAARFLEKVYGPADIAEVDERFGFLVAKEAAQ